MSLSVELCTDASRPLSRDLCANQEVPGQARDGKQERAPA